MAQAAKKDAAAGVPAPSIADVKAIAEEGFIYGLPIVMPNRMTAATATPRPSTRRPVGPSEPEMRSKRISSLSLSQNAEPSSVM